MRNQKKHAQKAEKKSESIEVRVPYTLKTDFMEKCSTNGDTASQVLRGSILNYLRPAARRHNVLKLASVMTMLSLFVAGVYTMQVAGFPGNAGSPTQQALFSIFDSNDDGFLTATDARDETRATLFTMLEGADENEDGRLSKREITELPTITLPAGVPTTSTREALGKARYLTLNTKGWPDADQLEQLKLRANLSDSVIADIAQHIDTVRLSTSP